ncbi:MAG: threonylcarbamoyl-AMP synthase [Firmicutes bacterium HGW-Firmicutes-20]|jgi:L-threonylcarbamoyladenylate synthase|nr:MAG: threonylcarbamoyl-AMP synthase [Firmicutes bacterium HGW-Firmicutes-20]PKM68988.1 MAG: threonylcarbamoyl-AMP synthase [Firmicutes bacterium HGW-Firmicutes-19]
MNTEIVELNEQNIDIEKLKRAAKIIVNLGTVVLPTETVYGLGANALSSMAVKKIFLAKGRPVDNPLIVHVCSIEMMGDLLQDPLDLRAKKLIEAFWPGPLTLVFKRSDKVPLEVCANLDTVAIRMPDHPIALKLIELANVPIAAPSANVSGKPSPTMAQHVIQDMDGRVDMIISADRSRIGVESTVLDISLPVALILRPGGVTLEQLQKVLGKEGVSLDNMINDVVDKPRSPGMKYTHYAPNATLQIVRGDKENIISYIKGKIYESVSGFIGVLCSDETKSEYQGAHVISIGSVHRLEQGASNLFAVLREFDQIGVDVIYAEAFGEDEMGLALMNRLKKAAGFNIVDV